jgi:hypothetical protein
MMQNQLLTTYRVYFPAGIKMRYVSGYYMIFRLLNSLEICFFIDKRSV